MKFDWSVMLSDILNHHTIYNRCDEKIKYFLSIKPTSLQVEYSPYILKCLHETKEDKDLLELFIDSSVGVPTYTVAQNIAQKLNFIAMNNYISNSTIKKFVLYHEFYSFDYTNKIIQYLLNHNIHMEYSRKSLKFYRRRKKVYKHMRPILSGVVLSDIINYILLPYVQYFYKYRK